MGTDRAHPLFRLRFGRPCSQPQWSAIADRVRSTISARPDVCRPSLRRRLRSAATIGLVGAVAATLVPAAWALDPKRPASGYNIRGWQSDAGLPSSRIRAVCQTRDGYLWVGTERGLVRFDGSNFQGYPETDDPVPRRKYISGFAEAPDGTLWAATLHGLYSYRNGAFQPQPGLASPEVRCVAVGPDGTVYAGSNTADIDVIGHGRVSAPRELQQKITGNIRAISFRPDGVIYIAGERGLCRVTGSSVEKLSETPTFRGRTYSSILTDADGRMWIGSEVGLYCVESNGKIRRYAEAEGLQTPRVLCLERDRDENLWVGTTGGLFRLHDGRFEPAVYPDSFGTSMVLALREDKDGDLWVASSVGLFRLRDAPVSTLSPANGLTDTVIHAVLPAHDGTWLIGAWTGGLYQSDGTHVQRAGIGNAGRLVQIDTLAEDLHGGIWIGGSAGLFELRGGVLTDFVLSAEAQARFKTAKSDLPGIGNRFVRQICATVDGGILVATHQALYRGRDRKFEVLAEQKGDTAVGFVAAIERRDGSIWAAKATSVGRVVKREWLPAPGLPPIHPRRLIEDSAGQLWVATDGEGVWRLHDARWSQFTSANGLVDDHIVSVAAENGFILLGSPHGLMCIERREFDAIADAANTRRTTLHVRTFTKADGMPVSECSGDGWPSLAPVGGDRVLVATDFGVAIVDLRRAQDRDEPPPVRLDGLVSGNTRFAPNENVSLPPDNPGVEFRYGAVQLSAPEKVRFRVRLLPLDEAWHDVADQRDIQYPRLQHGDYVFEVSARNSDGTWNPEPASARIFVRPYLYETAGFRLGAAGLIGVLAMGAYRWRMGRLRRHAEELRRHNAELEQHVAARTAELARSNESLRASQYFYRTLVESLPQIIVRKDANGRVTYANVKAAEFFRRPLEQVIGAFDRDLLPPDEARIAREHDERVMRDRKPVDYETVLSNPEGQKRYFYVKKTVLVDDAGMAVGMQTLCWDMTVLRETEEQLRRAQSELIEASRRAGVAETAASVLHNLGNAMNSVNTLATVVAGRLKQLKTSGMRQLAEMLLRQRERLPEFFASDQRGSQIPAYLEQFAAYLADEQAALLRDLEEMKGRIDHINGVVAAQGEHARAAGVKEDVAPSELAEFALRINEAELHRLGIEATREFESTPRVLVERHKVVQILSTLLRHAAASCNESKIAPKRVVLAVGHTEAGIRMSVTDNGAGFTAEQLAQFFAPKSGGAETVADCEMHEIALQAYELGGSIAATSPGPGQGATVVLQFPLASVAPGERAATASSARH